MFNFRKCYREKQKLKKGLDFIAKTLLNSLQIPLLKSIKGLKCRSRE